MNWYKAATKTAVSVTPAEFVAMTWDEKITLARNESITPATQRLFFTERYEMKDLFLARLAWNRSITLETQRLFFTEDYGNKSQVLEALAWSEDIHPEVQLLFLTQEYPKKNDILGNLAWNPIFLQNFTPEQMLIVKNAARGNAKLLVLSKRLKQLVGVP